MDRWIQAKADAAGSDQVSVIRAAGLTQRFGSRRALGPLDLTVEPGDRLAVLGDNGAGKTTLLRLLATLARPAAGRLELFGLDAAGPRDHIRPRIGHLGHQPALYGELTIRENLAFFATLHGLGGGAVGEAIEALGLAGLVGRRAGRLSRGQAQRVALARAVLHRPELLVLDEPDASLDEPGRALLAALLDGRTVVLATHDRALASKLCDRALTLHEGRAAAWTPPTDRGEVGGGPDQTGSPPMAPHLAALQPGGGTP